MANDEIIEIRLTGKDISPEKVRAGDIGEIITAVEEMISLLIIKNHPSITRESILIGITNIRKGSVELQFSSQLPTLAMPAFTLIADSIATGKFNELPVGSVKALQTIATFTRKKHCIAELIALNGDPTILATISPDTKIEPSPLITGETVIYGQLIRVGGRTPRAMIETVDGQTIYCEVEKGLAKNLGEKLYSYVGLHGTAKWNANTLALEEFFIDDLTDYRDKKIFESTRDLSSLVGKYFSTIKDVKGYVSRLRGMGEES